MGELRNRKSEHICKMCGANSVMRGGYLTRHNGKIMQRQYRLCEGCGQKIVTYKDLDTKEITFGKVQNGKVVNGKVITK